MLIPSSIELSLSIIASGVESVSGRAKRINASSYMVLGDFTHFASAFTDESREIPFVIFSKVSFSDCAFNFTISSLL